MTGTRNAMAGFSTHSHGWPQSILIFMAGEV